MIIDPKADDLNMTRRLKTVEQVDVAISSDESC